MPAGPPDDEAVLLPFDELSNLPQPVKKRTDERQNEKRIVFMKKI